MPTGRTYLDYNASAPLLDAARDAMIECLGTVGNGSSVHHEGRHARKAIEQARSDVAKLVGAKSAQVTFTSGATEAANHVLSPLFNAGGHVVRVSKLYVSAVEHPCVLSGGRFKSEDIAYLPVLESGVIDLDQLQESLAQHDDKAGLAMVAVMAANNETGVCQPIEQISEIAHQNDAIVVVDGVQALGKVPLDMTTLGAHFVLVSSHKIGGSQGAGALIARDASFLPAPLFKGGGQESYQRGGTENVAAIAGFGAACRWHLDNLDQPARIRLLRDNIESGVKQISRDAGNEIAEPVIFGEQANRLPNTSAFCVPGIEAEMALIGLDLAGVSVSSGSACSSGRISRSHVLKAMNVGDDLADCALRISLGHNSEKQHIEHFLSAWREIVHHQL